jgi:hypothetical protein
MCDLADQGFYGVLLLSANLDLQVLLFAQSALI